MVLPIILGIFGLFIGSFLNLLIDRWYKGEQVSRGRSKCDSCGHVLGFFDLIPLLSFLFLRGKCRYCKKSISWINPVVEVVLAAGFAIIGLAFASEIFNFQLLTLGFLYWSVVYCLLVITFFGDIKYGVIYNEVIAIGIIVVFLYWLIGGIWEIKEMREMLIKEELGRALMEIGYLKDKALFMVKGRLFDLAGAFGAFGFFYFLRAWFKGRALGGGDVKLAFLIGLITGFPNVLVALFFGFLTGAFVGVILLVTGRKGLKSRIAFGPFLVFGTIIGFVFGSQIINWYLGLL